MFPYDKAHLVCCMFRMLQLDHGLHCLFQTEDYYSNVEDEQHFLIEYSKFNEYRNKLFQTVNCNNKNFSKLDNFQKFFWLLTNEDSDILHILGLYLHEHLE